MPKRARFPLIGASEVALVLAIEKLWNVLGAFLFLHEVITLQKVLEAIIILVGLGIVLYNKKKFTFNKDVIFALLAGFLFGMRDINGFYMLKTIDATSFLIYADFCLLLRYFLYNQK